MRILVTNDDGIMAPGVAALYRAVRDLGEVEVVAPETSQSAGGHSISVLSPMMAHRVHVHGEFEAWSVDGSPADCVKLAILKLLKWRPDFVLSGVNAGVNTAINVLYSGTVAGAIEGACFGIPAMAFSLELSEDLDFDGAGAVARSLFLEFVKTQPEPGVCLNVNIPKFDDGWPHGTRVVPQAVVPMQDRYHVQHDPRGNPVYWLDGAMPDHPVDSGTDLAAIYERYVAITPLRFDLTDHKRMAAMAAVGWPQAFERMEAPTG